MTDFPTSAVHAAFRGAAAARWLASTSRPRAASAAQHRIIEVGIVLLDRGEVVEEWSTLVQPGRADTCGHRGLHRDRRRDGGGCTAVRATCAPRCGAASTAGCSWPTTRASTTASCAPSFDALGERFSAPVLCTVRLSRALFTEHPRHNLDTLIDRFGLELQRASPGARRRAGAAGAARGDGSESRRGRRARRGDGGAARATPAAAIAGGTRRRPARGPRACTCFAAMAAPRSTSAGAATCAAAFSGISPPSIAPARKRGSRSRCGRSNGSKPAANSARCCSNHAW